MGEYWTQRPGLSPPHSYSLWCLPPYLPSSTSTWTPYPLVLPVLRSLADALFVAYTVPASNSSLDYNFGPPDPARHARIANWASQTYPAIPAPVTAVSNLTDSTWYSAISHGSAPPQPQPYLASEYASTAQAATYGGSSYADATYAPSTSYAGATYVPSTIATGATYGSSTVRKQGKGGLKGLFGKKEPISTTWYAPVDPYVL